MLHVRKKTGFGMIVEAAEFKASTRLLELILPVLAAGWASRWASRWAGQLLVGLMQGGTVTANFSVQSSQFVSHA